MTTPDSVTCEWTFTDQEYVTTKLLGRRLNHPRLYMGLVFIFVAIMLLPTVTGSPTGKMDDSIVFQLLAMAVFLICFASYKRLPIRSFIRLGRHRNSDLYNARMIQTIAQDGIALDNRGIRNHLVWQDIGRAIETSEGFALLFPGSGARFSWLPKKGFADESCVSRAREILMTHIPKFRVLAD
jgi:hypothetical protein